VDDQEARRRRKRVGRGDLRRCRRRAGRLGLGRRAGPRSGADADVRSGRDGRADGRQDRLRLRAGHDQESDEDDEPSDQGDPDERRTPVQPISHGRIVRPPGSVRER
jgi:hypothetical protein